MEQSNIRINSHVNNWPERKSGLVMPFRAMPTEHDYLGTLGAESIDFLEVIRDAGFSILHDLPNTPPDEYDCPYSSTSSFAIDPQRIDLRLLAQTGDISPQEAEEYQRLVTYGDTSKNLAKAKLQLLMQAYVNFNKSADTSRKTNFLQWQEAEANWLDPYATYEILKNLPENHGQPWQEWSKGKDFSPELVAEAKTSYGQAFAATAYQQWISENQTLEFMKAAETLDVEIWGDVPFYTGPAEVWANREVFHLDEQGNQLTKGGARPSDTSTTGQVWGNATYNIDPQNNPDATAKAIDWWIRRLERALKLNNGQVRLDHFIGFAEPYIIEAQAQDGLEGWRGEGMGSLLFDKLVDKFGENLPFCPEDQGTMTEATPKLRDDYGLSPTALQVRAITKHVLDLSYDLSPHNPDSLSAEYGGLFEQSRLATAQASNRDNAHCLSGQIYRLS